MANRRASFRRSRLGPRDTIVTDSKYKGKGGGSGGDNSSKDGSSESPQTNVPDPTVLGLPPNCLNDQRLMQPGCTFVNENSGTFKYSEGWSQFTTDQTGLKHTYHFTNQTDASVVIPFSGPTVVGVFGTVPPGQPPVVSYAIDGQPGTVVHTAAAAQCIPNQAFFVSNTIGSGNHDLTIRVENVSAVSPYILDYLWFCNTIPKGLDMSKESDSDSQPSHSGASKTNHFPTRIDGVIIGSVLGGVFFLLGIALLFWYLQRRKRRQEKLRKLHIAASPVASWLRWQSQSGDSRTILTSSSSILRDNLTYSHSSDTKSRAVSMPPQFPLPEKPPGIPPYSPPSRSEVDDVPLRGE